MTGKQIEQLKKRIEKAKSKVITGREDKNLADMSNMPGWEVLKALMESIEFAMLVPISKQEAKEIGDLNMIGAMTFARGLVVETLQDIIDLVENTKASEKEKKDKKEQEEFEKDEEEESEQRALTGFPSGVSPV